MNTNQLVLPAVTIMVILWRWGWRPFVEFNHARDEFDGDWTMTRGLLRLVINGFCIVAIGLQPPDDEGAAGKFRVVLLNVSAGIWKDPYRTRGHAEYNMDKE